MEGARFRLSADIPHIPRWYERTVDLDEWWECIESMTVPNGFEDQGAMLHVFNSNKFEGTLPQGLSQGKTYQHLAQVQASAGEHLTDEVLFNPRAACWDAEGHRTSERTTKSQLTQHMLALRFLLAQETLNADVLVKTHKILMWRALDEDRVLMVPTSSHSFRTGPVHVGDLQCPPAPEVSKLIRASLDRFNSQLNRPTQHPIVTVAQLLHTMLFIHPFTNGNGRLCRMVAAFAFRKLTKLDAILNLGTGTKKARSHYRRALRRADGCRDNRFSELCFLILLSLRRVYDNIVLLEG